MGSTILVSVVGVVEGELLAAPGGGGVGGVVLREVGAVGGVPEEGVAGPVAVLDLVGEAVALLVAELLAVGGVADEGEVGHCLAACVLALNEPLITFG